MNPVTLSDTLKTKPQVRRVTLRGRPGNGLSVTKPRVVATVSELADLLAPLDPELVALLEPEPAWVWARCPSCHEVRYQRRAADLGRCLLTPGCKGKMEPYLQLLCRICGRNVSTRRRDTNIEFCSKKCEKEAG
jgi:hypothetical protein